MHGHNRTDKKTKGKMLHHKEGSTPRAPPVQQRRFQAGPTGVRYRYGPPARFFFFFLRLRPFRPTGGVNVNLAGGVAARGRRAPGV